MQSAGLRALVLSAALVAAGCCARQQVIQPPPIMLPIPEQLTAPCGELTEPETVRDLYLAYASARMAVEDCSARMALIRKATGKQVSAAVTN